MKNLPGSIGTSGSFALRLGQAIFASSSLFFIVLVTVMGLVIPWSFTLALLDGYSILVKCPLRHSGILHVVITGDSVLSILTLAAASSTASIVDLLLKADDVSFCSQRLCSRYQISAVMAFLSWFLSLFHCNKIHTYEEAEQVSNRKQKGPSNISLGNRTTLRSLDGW
ncbi:hypothetical protein ACJIZ3_015441 [Penstemon smallii]|uniref:CASP-like protein n=1 Tax=Penstemon smallii TaxID=265156 RepID=A0ABD3RML9_9LAMI